MIAQAETLKKEWTDKYVVVREGIAELRRFVGLTGKVKTVNMNCRALVEFDGPEDISWYDIDPSFLVIVDAPQPKKKAEAAKTEPEKKSSPKPTGGKSPLEMARQQGSAKAKSGDSGKKLSPLEQARQQGAAAKAGAAPSGSEKKLSPLELARQQGAAGSPKKEAKPASDKPLSPLEQARQQGAAKVEAPESEEETPVATEQAPVEQASQAEESDASTASPTAPTPSSTADIIELARKQGAFKG